MYRIWFWAMIDRESDGRFIASIPDLGDLAAYGDTDKDAVAHVTELAGERVRAAVDDGQPVPQRRHFSEMPSHIRTKEVGEPSSRWKWTDGQRGQLRRTTCPLEPLLPDGKA
jgi:predicted RNase H-like HicB family nuclease